MKIREKANEISKAEDIRHINAALSGDQDAFAWLMKKYKGPLQNLIYKMVSDKNEIEDLIQEVFIKAFNSLRNYSQEYAFSTWIYRIAINNTIDYLRKKKLETFSIDIDSEEDDDRPKFEIPDSSYSADANIILEQRQQIINDAINSLPEKYKKVIELRHKEELSYEEISEILNLPIGTVKAHLFRARELLNKYLKDKLRFL
ncbi:MAG: sigma-70 family RNA polymerase sigma factor [Ignavibacteria bacterium]|jgi:RNA polymerase sigma-70 factor (ECF subfamily)|nr:sigma-70 family RNA polymerase sigma factor [Ignavibacteria bacterium]MDH7527035.1 sigma-70 family RNA polymerase sigma factor [Ignavibacteria bacterium]NPV10820.1 sigma-70 family RNA polymerase sigma factor [Ignavibacteria bacterium]